MGGLDGITRVLTSGRGRQKLRFRGDVTTEVSERDNVAGCAGKPRNAGGF